MKKLTIAALLISLIIENSRAQTTISPIVSVPADKVYLLEKGTEAPFKGYLFPEEKALNLRKELVELDGLKALEKSYLRSIDLYKLNEDRYNNKINILLEQNDKLSTSIINSEKRSEWENRIWFIMGIGVTGLAVYGASQLSR